MDEDASPSPQPLPSEMERTAESPALSSVRPHTARVELLDAPAAVRLAETTIGSTLLEAIDQSSSAASLLATAREAAEKGRRVAIVARGEAFSSAREAMREIASSRLAVVAHALAGHGGEDLAAFSDLGWGVLCASGPEDSFDLALVARRAAEDAGVPFLVVHALAHASPAGRAVAMAALPQEKSCQAFVGPAARMRSRNDPAHPSFAPASDRAFAERAPFALGSALREYGNVSGRRHDVFDKTPLGEAPLMLVGMGPVGDALFCAIAELRRLGYDVGGVHLSTLRPFPGARLVKALARALAVTVLESADEPLSHGGLLARELKSAFTDALTWAPGFPGIGRIPKLFTGVTGPSFDLADLAAVCDNMLADERGQRSFSFADAEHALPRAQSGSHLRGGPIALRCIFDDDVTAALALSATTAVFASALGLRAEAIATGTTIDLLAAREHARGGMARRLPRLVLATERGVGSASAVAPLAPGVVLGVVTAGSEPLLPDAARAVVREKRVRALPLACGGGEGDSARAVAFAATCAGAALAAGARPRSAAGEAPRSALDGAAVARVVTEYFAARPGTDAAATSHAAMCAARAFEATLEALGAADAEAADGYRSGTAPVS
ncbi:MAG: hypothetical protein KF819_25080 [Labilithrix sp.]|nr:hypothetical protein [Labilithrix sp.]